MSALSALIAHCSGRRSHWVRLREPVVRALHYRVPVVGTGSPSATTRLLVTGANGNLGRKALAALARRDDVETLSVVGLDSPAGGDGVVRADLSVFDTGWASAFEGVDVVLHLAGDGRPAAGWNEVLHSNVELTLNVLRAAEQAGVARFVFASSNYVVAGYRFTVDPLRPDMTPWPVNPYGVSKLLGERVGFAAAARTGMSFLAMRIGYCQPGDNVPGPHMAFGRWGQQMWLSNEDWAHAAEQACTAPFEGAAVINVMSENAGMRWDLAESARLIGYRPRSGHVPRLTVRRRIEDVAARARHALRSPGLPAPSPGSRW